MSVLIMPHRVVLNQPRDSNDGPDFDGARRWCEENAGVQDMDHGQWFFNSFNHVPAGRTDVFRFLDPRTAVMFKLMWGGA